MILLIIGKIKDGHFAGAFRPEEHAFNNDTGKLFHGGNTVLHQIKIPSSMKCHENHIYCRKCDDFAVEFHEKMNFRMQAKRVRKMKLHENTCKKKPSSEEKK